MFENPYRRKEKNIMPDGFYETLYEWICPHCWSPILPFDDIYLEETYEEK